MNKQFCAFIDFQKAYDKINRNLVKLQRIVKFHNGVLDPIASTLGLRQGGVLSPLPFNLFIHDINGLLDETCDPLLALGKPVSSALCRLPSADVNRLKMGKTRCLAELEAYCHHNWQLDVNIKKSKVVIFNPSGRKLVACIFIFRVSYSKLCNHIVIWAKIFYVVVHSVLLVVT